MGWEFCDCEHRAMGLFYCDCGCGLSLIFEDSVHTPVHWKGKHYSIMCALNTATDLLDDLADVMVSVEGNLHEGAGAVPL
jgi:hypothetical protein